MKSQTKSQKISSLLALSTTGLLSFSAATAATFDLSGDYRFGTNMYQNVDLVSGNAVSGATDNLNFWEHRFRLNPDVLIDQHFKFRSQMIFLGATGGAPTNNVPTSFGSGLDSAEASQQGLYLQQAYLEWSSDWGLLRVGRVPKAWGLGVLYRQPDPFLADFASVSDRIDFKAMLNNLSLTLAFEKQKEGLLRRDSDDAETYILSMDYSSPESGLASGILYERSVNGPGANIGRSSSHDLSIFAKKTWGTFNLGAEFAMLNESGDNPRNGILFQASQDGKGLRYGLDLAFASSSSGDNFSFHPNYRPFLILFRHNLGPNVAVEDVRGGGGAQSLGSDVTGNGGGGAYLGRAHLAHQFRNSSFQLGGQLGWASLIDEGSAGSKNLGFEFDLSLVQKWYENFKVYYAGGVLFPGSAWASNPKVTWGLELKGVLEF